MVAEPWIIRMGSHVSTNLKHSSGKTKHDQKQTVGILSFEVANVMSKTLHLHRSLTHSEISKLKTQILNSDGVKNLISSDESYLLQLTVAEKLDDLNRVAGVVSRLGKKCSVPALQGFEHVYGDILRGAIDVKGLGFLVKDMDSMVRKMERYVNSTANLYSEMEVLNELEQGIKKFQQNQHEESRRVFEQKLVWKKQDVKHLQDVSLWNQTYDKVVELLARTICTIYARICLVFGDAVLIAQLGGKWGQIDEKRLFGMSSNRSRPVLNKGTGSNQSGTTERAKLGSGISQFRPQLRQHRAEVPIFRAEDFNFVCGIGPGRLFMECLSLSSSGSKLDEDEGIVVDDRSSHASACCSVASSVKRGLPRAQSVLNGSQFSPKGRLALFAPPSTVGGSALALHYANVIIVIEKLLRYPHLVGEEARDDLYQMLPTSLRMSLKTSLKSYVKDLAIYDAPLAHDWKERLDEILRWLSPLAHNMIRWQTERNFEQHQIVTRTNVLLLQTIYFADRAKTEAAICELLVGLNYICRYEHQQNALLDCASSFDFDDCVDWQMQY